MSDIDQFKTWLIAQGGEILELQGPHEKIRVQMPGHRQPLVMYETVRRKQEWTPALLELHTRFEAEADG